jgi:hypothetical protein
MAIPLPAALNANGTPKRPGPRSWSNTFVRESRKGNVIIFQRKGRKIVPLYLLRRKVRIPRRLGLRYTFRTTNRDFVDRMIDTIASKLNGDLRKL